MEDGKRLISFDSQENTLICRVCGDEKMLQFPISGDDFKKHRSLFEADHSRCYQQQHRSPAKP